MSIGSVLSSARLALQAQTTAMETASHNIANATVEGYSRQRVDLQPNVPLYTPWGAVGTGVVVANIQRVRDTMLDTSYRSQASQSGQYATRRDLLTRIGNVFGEPSESGLSSTLDQFWSAWGDLANSPTSTAAKSVVQQRGSQLASALNRFSGDMDGVAASASEQVTTQVNLLNRYASQIAGLNQTIVAAESGGQSANDIRDMRDRALDEMNKIAPVRMLEEPNGAATVYMSGISIVDGVTTKQLSLDHSGASLLLKVAGQASSIGSPGGSLGAALGVINTDVPKAKAQLDDLAAGIVAKINAVHRTGWTGAGDALGGANWDATAPPTGSNVDFFDSSKTTAGTISLSTAVASNGAYIAAGDVQNATGNNSVASAVATVRRDTDVILKSGSSTLTTSFGEYYRDLVTRVGVDTSDADSSATVYETLTQQADAQRQSVSGVSTDDELIEMTKRQQAYSAAAKVITAANDMSQTLLDMIR
ncbi:MAG: flagellar hook-associated protein FlgK [Gemmatimonadaceae bacterium]